MRRGGRALALGLFVVGLGAGWTAHAARRGPAGPTEQGRIDGTRLTSPFIEAPGTRDGDARVVAFRTSVEGLLEPLFEADPSLGVSVYLRDLEAGPWTGIDEDASYVPASLMKVGVLFHALARLERDPDLATVRIRYPGPDSMPSPDNLAGVPAPRHMVEGEEYPFLELVERMVAYSDNHAKDLVMAGVPPEAVDSLLAAIGVPGLADDDGRAVMTARSYAALFRMLYHSTVFSRTTSEQALEFLRRADFGAGIRAGLPPSTPVASKYGLHFDARDLEAGQQLHECGIVYVPDGSPFTICVMTRSLLQSRDDLATLVAEIAHRAWTVMVTARGAGDSVSLGGD